MNKTIKSQLKIKWKTSGEAALHLKCWEDILKAARSRKKPSILIKMEKIMITQAAKTVEKHDSEDYINVEASRIADMIKTAQHCVAFTGAGISTSAGIGDYR